MLMIYWEGRGGRDRCTCNLGDSGRQEPISVGVCLTAYIMQLCTFSYARQLFVFELGFYCWFLTFSVESVY